MCVNGRAKVTHKVVSTMSQGHCFYMYLVSYGHKHPSKHEQCDNELYRTSFYIPVAGASKENSRLQACTLATSACVHQWSVGMVLLHLINATRSAPGTASRYAAGAQETSLYLPLGLVCRYRLIYPESKAMIRF